MKTEERKSSNKFMAQTIANTRDWIHLGLGMVVVFFLVVVSSHFGLAAGVSYRFFDVDSRRRLVESPPLV